MAFAKGVWKLLVGIKDGLSLLFLLLFFMALYAVLTARPSPAQVREGALLLELDGVVVEEKSVIDPLELFLSGTAPIGEYDAQDLVHAIDAATGDDRIKAIVLDLTGFLGGGHVHLQDIGEALQRARDAEKPVLTYGIGYGDDAMMLAAHASEVWLDPLGGAIIAGPGGNRLYFGQFLEDLNINARIYKVGTYKSAVEPFDRSDMSPEARENAQALYGALWEEWQAKVKKARPAIDLDTVTGSPAEWVAASQGDLAQAALAAGLVDTLGSRVEFGERVAEIAGEDDWEERPGAFAHTAYDAWLSDNARDTSGSAIGVVTVAGEIVDGEAGPGTAGGDRIAELLDAALSDDLAGLIVRVDSPGGSVLASEAIRDAVLRHKAKGIPIAVSMANVAASGGYWVSTPADRIFAEPETITGSIGIFAVIPTFENLAAEYGVNADGVATTSLSGQPDLIAGFTPEVDAILQSSIEDGYRDFLTRVSEARKLPMERVDAIGQGRVWDGGTARQIGLVDQYGGLEEALDWVAAQAELEEGDWHVRFLGNEQQPFDNLLRTMLLTDSESAPAGDIFGMVATRQQALLGQVRTDLERLLGTRGMQAYCLACPVTPRARAEAAADDGWFAQMAAFFAR
ncbi:signal peptide peptidase SppA [Erythrobacter litoralis]|uniref:Periplasmic serine protease n=1 Tax=Erythrobacter litoralis (strain HTCC2594) TaxID=314225 RepID=Q2NDE4_ERYLH|nr:signal peptide peptidase SppA [Erythrobacter litoralis]ABC62297.1 periplasmic serine protease [Erythrobacter litoralis HTCC2594]